MRTRSLRKRLPVSTQQPLRCLYRPVNGELVRVANRVQISRLHHVVRNVYIGILQPRMGRGSDPYVPLWVRQLWSCLRPWFVDCWSCLGNLVDWVFIGRSCCKGASNSIKELDFVSFSPYSMVENYFVSWKCVEWPIWLVDWEDSFSFSRNRRGSEFSSRVLRQVHCCKDRSNEVYFGRKTVPPMDFRE